MKQIILFLQVLFFTNYILAQNTSYYNFDEELKLINSITNNYKAVKTYKHQDFKLSYPESWKMFETKFLERDIVLRIAKSDQIYDAYLIPDEETENGVLEGFVLPKDYDKETIEDKYLKYVNDSTYLTKFSKNQFNISVEPLKIKSLSQYIKKKRQRIKEVSAVKGLYKRVNKWHYKGELEISVDGNEIDSPPVTHFHKIHYYYKKDKLYTLVYTKIIDELSDIDKKNIDQIFNSFEFTDK